MVAARGWGSPKLCANLRQISLVFRVQGYGRKGLLHNHFMTQVYMDGCQNYGPFLGTLNIRGRIIIGIQKGTIILTTIHIV